MIGRNFLVNLTKHEEVLVENNSKERLIQLVAMEDLPVALIEKLEEQILDHIKKRGGRAEINFASSIVGLIGDWSSIEAPSFVVDKLESKDKTFAEMKSRVCFGPEEAARLIVSLIHKDPEAVRNSIFLVRVAESKPQQAWDAHEKDDGSWVVHPVCGNELFGITTKIYHK